MQGQGVLMIGLMSVHLCTFFFTPGETATDQNAADFLTTIENGVTAVAMQVKANDAVAKRCERKTCQCSRRECYRRKDENNLSGLQCVYTANNTTCPSKTDSPCHSIRANLNESYVRIPPLNFTFAYTVERAVGNTVCAQIDLDSTFISAYNNVSQTLEQINTGRPIATIRTYCGIYFGAVDGSFRYFPGQETINQSNCNKYDPRVRPWYTGAISVVKDLVILLDTGVNMQQTFFGFDGANSSSPLELAKRMTASVMATLTANDRATIVLFNESLSTSSENWTVPASGLENSNISQQSDNFLHVGRESGQPDPKIASNFTAAFVKASSVFNDSGSPNQALKIVILITNNRSYPLSQQDRQTALKFETAVRLFVYEIPKDDDNYTSPWASICCAIDGYNEQLYRFAVVVNPLSSVTSYFSFLARSHIMAAQGTNLKPYWQTGYVDANGLGNVTTATSLVMSADGLQLIGVVGLDTQLDGFIDEDLKTRVQNYVLKQQNKIPSYASGAKFPNCSVSNVSTCEDQNTPTDVFCTDEIDSKASPASVLCCDECGNTGEKNRDLRLTRVLTPSILGTWFLLLLTVVVVKLKCLYNPHPRREVNQPPMDTRPPIAAYSFEDICIATNNFDNSQLIDSGVFGVQYKATLEGEPHVVIKQLSHRTNDSGLQPVLTLDIEGHSCQLTHKGTASGPVTQRELPNGNIFDPSDRFLVYMYEIRDLRPPRRFRLGYFCQ